MFIQEAKEKAKIAAFGKKCFLNKFVEYLPYADLY